MSRRGFTLIELLVVIAVIAILIAMLVPAVQKVREASARAQCQNNIKQMGIALHNHHDTNKSFPKGCQDGPTPFGSIRQGWPPYLLPYVEQGAAASLYDLTQSPFGTSNSATPTSATNTNLAVWLCPSDRGVVNVKMPWGYFSLGNYMPFFGLRDLGDAFTAPLSQRTAMAPNYGARINEITDGTSNTMIMSEYLRSTGGAPNPGEVEQRGMVWQSDETGGGSITAKFPPNTASNDVFYPNWWCVNDPLGNLPCITGTTNGSDHTAAARSRHTGGVNVLLCDGSVRFVDQSVNLATTWRPLVTIAGEETIGDF